MRRVGPPVKPEDDYKAKETKTWMAGSRPAADPAMTEALNRSDA
jgi:hypothetical protein